MSGIKRKVKRKLSSNLASYGNKVDIKNENQVKRALEIKAGRVKILHPTKGFRDVSLEGFGAVGNKAVMWEIIKGVIENAGGTLPYNDTNS